MRLYQAKNRGKPPATLDDLVPRYLPALPIDPFDGKPFRYRVSRGDKLAWGKEEPPIPPPGPQGPMPAGPLPPVMPAAPPLPPLVQIVPAGQAILWSVGEDLRDDGGKRGENNGFGPSTGTDLIYLVPLPPR